MKTPCWLLQHLPRYTRGCNVVKGISMKEPVEKLPSTRSVQGRLGGGGGIGGCGGPTAIGTTVWVCCCCC
ncbi:hypothetical protein HanRHA438_Chr05g0233041 [Helianthus annuus]|nr:hypothetical protein HanHA89_Chr05g0198081 [Helianthus annuus]KAJ0919738.1 hypothetical protein HanRHA438_Chr05g0233041 [Helianthus annuus]